MTALTIAGQPVKVLTVRQPWAWAIAYGGKDVENRTTLWRYRGWVLTHAGAGWSDRGEHDPRIIRAWWDLAEEYELDPDDYGPDLLLPALAWDTGGAGPSEELQLNLRSHVLSLSRLVDAHRAGPDCGDDCAGSVWPEHEYHHADGRTIHNVVHLVLHDTRPLPDPIPYPFGGLGLRDPRPELVDEVRRQLEIAA